jgi:hypothetical protein
LKEPAGTRVSVVGERRPLAWIDAQDGWVAWLASHPAALAVHAESITIATNTNQCRKRS